MGLTIDLAALSARIQTDFPALAHSHGLSLREEQACDLPFAAELYAQSRAAELAAVPWTEAQKRTFCQQQFEAQHAHYTVHYPRARFLIILGRGTSVGRLYFEHTNFELRLMELALVARVRGRGLGTLLSQVLAALADEAGVPTTLHVESFNPARRLYERLGFREVETRGIYLFMQRDCAEGGTPNRVSTAIS